MLGQNTDTLGYEAIPSKKRPRNNKNSLRGKMKKLKKVVKRKKAKKLNFKVSKENLKALENIFLNVCESAVQDADITLKTQAQVNTVMDIVLGYFENMADNAQDDLPETISEELGEECDEDED